MSETPRQPESPPPAPSAGEVVKRLGPAGVLGLIWTVVPAVAGTMLLVYANSLGEWLRTHGTDGVLVYAGGFTVLAGLGIMPTYAAAFLGGWAFGFQQGYPAALVGFLGGAVIGYGIARLASGRRVVDLIEEHRDWRAVVDALVRGSPVKVLAIITLLRLPPNSPFALTNLVLASVRAPLWAYIPGTLLGMAPRTGVVVYLAAQLSSLSAKEAAEAKMPKWLLISGIVAAVVVILIIGSIARNVLRRVTAGGKPAEPA